jgi:hypothetical protein
MKKIIPFIFLLILSGEILFSQDLNWRVNVFNFFDNTEFSQSKFKVPQTMAGIVVSPEAGLLWDTVNKINIGTSLIHEYGSQYAIDRFYPTAYYETDRRVRFIMGAFPRSSTIENYPRLFFQDSVSYYRPNINGLFVEYRKEDYHINIWLDWTGRQSKTVNEQFFIGFSGKYRTGLVFLEHFGAMYHYASKSDPVVEEPLHDNLLFLTSAGIDLSGKTVLNRLEAKAGWAVRLERSRAENSGWITSKGFLVEARAEYRRIGIYNSMFFGDNMMHYYPQLGNRLYWGDPVYRAKSSNRADLYISFIRNHTVNVDLTYSLTFMEGKIFHEQLLKVIIDLNSAGE